jgi:spermidine/putrescine transport system ATP-binding protein
MAGRVELKDIVKKFGESTAVDHISFAVEAGEFFSMLGPSGSGKTTTLRVIAGFEEPTAGLVEIDGLPVNDVPPHERNVGMVFQQLALFTHMNVFNNVAFGLKMKHESKSDIRRKVEAVLSLVNLSGLANRRINQLSGGQQQRVALARALVTEPSVLCFDEPLGSLDLKLRLQMQVELRKLHERVKNTFIYVTHDQGEAMTVSDKIAIMNEGHIEQIGSPLDVYEHPTTAFVADFIGEANILEGELKAPDLLECSGLEIVAYTPPGKPFSGKASVSVRPEKIQIGRKLDEDLDNCFECEIESKTYKGAHIIYRVNVDGKIKLNVQQIFLGDQYDVGEKVQLGWKRNHATVILM